MNPAVLSLAALMLALALSMSSRINVGWLALAFAWLIGVHQAGLRPDAVMAGFPVTLFLTLAGVTLLFSIAEANGTLDRLARRAILLTRGSRRMIPVLLFVVACVLSSVGPGAISTVALLAPLAMAVGQQVGAVAAVSDQQQSRELFRQLMTWGLSMTIIGAALCQLFAGALARA